MAGEAVDRAALLSHAADHVHSSTHESQAYAPRPSRRPLPAPRRRSCHLSVPSRTDGAIPPAPVDLLIARDQELAAVVSLLRDPAVRLLTLTGPGGVGKTRLAIAAAADVANDFPDGVVFVDLSPIANPDLVLDTIAGALGLRDMGTESLHDRLIDVLADRRMLLVLDNFEQVVTAAPRVRDLLDACPGVTLLITSRIRLRVSGEREFPVAPLPLEHPDHGRGCRGVRRGPALHRARTGHPARFQPHRRDDCRRLPRSSAGSTASRSRSSWPPRGSKPCPRRRCCNAWNSGCRCSAAARGICPCGSRPCATRSGGATTCSTTPSRPSSAASRSSSADSRSTPPKRSALARRSAADEPSSRSPPIDVLDGITALIEHSLLRQSAGVRAASRATRCWRPIREFGWEQLDRERRGGGGPGAHAAWCLALAEEAEPALWGAGQVGWLDRLDREKDNLRAALHWTLDRVEIETATRLGAALWRFWERRGYLSEGRSHLASILALSPSPASLAARCGALTGAGVLAALQGDYDQAIRHSEDALAGWRQLGDHRGIARSLLCLAAVARYRDDFAGAESLGHESLAAFRTIDDRWGAGHVLTHLGMLAWLQGNHATGIAFYEEALAHLRDVGDQSGIFEIVLELGRGACDAGDLARATALFEECLALATSMGDGPGRGRALTELGVVARLRGDHARATDLLTQATALAQENGDRRQLAYLAWHLGDVDIATGDIGSAAARYAEALGLFLPMGNRVGIAQCLEKLARCALIRGHLSSAARLLGSCAALFSAIGVTPPPDRDPATDVASLKPRLSPAEFARAWDAGRALSPAEAAAEALALAADLAEEGHAEAPPDAWPATDPPRPPGRTSSPVAALGLTPREVEVLRLLAEGMSDREIADALSISERTAGNHVQHAMQKIGVDSRTAAAVFAVRHDLD